MHLLHCYYIYRGMLLHPFNCRSSIGEYSDDMEHYRVFFKLLSEWNSSPGIWCNMRSGREC